MGLLQASSYGVIKMAETQHQSSTSPPKKNRDPLLLGRSQDERMQSDKRYISETLKKSGRESIRQGTMSPTSVRIGIDRKKQLAELRKRLFTIEEKDLLKMAFAYGYTEAKQRQISADKLRSSIKTVQLDEAYISFEIDEAIFNILCESDIPDDAQFIYLNAGIDLLYSRLVRDSVPSFI